MITRNPHRPLGSREDNPRTDEELREMIRAIREDIRMLEQSHGSMTIFDPRSDASVLAELALRLQARLILPRFDD